MKEYIKKIVKVLRLQFLIRIYHGIIISFQNVSIRNQIKEQVENSGGKLSYNGNLILIAMGVNQYALRKHSSDLKVFKQLIIENEYKSVIDLIEKHKININTIIDAGANIGLSMIYFKKFYGNANIVCIEPDEGNSEMIAKQIQNNKLLNVYVEKAGLWDSNKFLAIKRDFRDGAKWSLRVDAVDYETKLKGISIKYLIDKYKLTQIDLLKIDIEGSEKVLFDNDEDLASYIDKVKIICIEVHEEFISTQSVVTALESHHFSVFKSRDLTIGINNRKN